MTMILMKYHKNLYIQKKLHKILSNIIENKYPDYITANSLKNKNFIAICKNINLEIYKCFNIESLL